MLVPVPVPALALALAPELNLAALSEFVSGGQLVVIVEVALVPVAVILPSY